MAADYCPRQYVVDETFTKGTVQRLLVRVGSIIRAPTSTWRTFACSPIQAPRTHRIPPGPDGRPVPVGWTTVNKVHKYVEEHPEEVGILPISKVQVDNIDYGPSYK